MPKKPVLATVVLCISMSACGGESLTAPSALTAQTVQATAELEGSALATAATKAAAVKATRARSLSVYFDILPTPHAGQADSHDPNLVFLEFRGGIAFSKPGAIATATLFVDGVALGSTTVDNNSALVELSGSPAWEFAASGFPTNPFFQHYASIDFTPIWNGHKGIITLTVDSGLMEFGAPPYTTNAPLVVFDYITCCTTFWPVTMDAQNLTYEVTFGGKPL